MLTPNKKVIQDYTGHDDDETSRAFSDIDKLFDAYDAWVAAQEFMVSEILKDPIAYFDPEKYLLDVNMGKWVAAPFYIATSAPLFVKGDWFFDKWVERA